MDFSIWVTILSFIAMISLAGIVLSVMFDPLLMVAALGYFWERKIRQLQPDITYRGYLLLSYAAERKDPKLRKLGQGALKFQVIVMAAYALLGILLILLSGRQSTFSWDNAGIFLGLFMLVFGVAVSGYAYRLLCKARKVYENNHA